MVKNILVTIVLALSAVPASGQVSYDRKTQLLSVTFDGAPLREVLGEISRKTGITVYIDPSVDKNVFIDRKRSPVDEVLNEIIKPLNSLVIYRGDAVVAVRIYEQSPADAMQKIEPGVRPASAPPSAAAQSAPGGGGQPPSARQAPDEAGRERPERLRSIREERLKELEERKAERDRRRQELKEKRGGAWKQRSRQNANGTE